MNQKRLRTILLLTVVYTILVILWGAWVRISHSGDGCGDTWPLCQGQIIPAAERSKTWIEYAHRLMSGLYGVLVFLIFFWVRKYFPVAHRARRLAMWLLIFCVVEALLGAKLVLFGLVGSNDSFYRAFIMGIHQINSLLLTGVSALLYMVSSEDTIRPPLKFPGKAYVKYLLFMVIAMTGAWAALSTTLFPSMSLLEGWQKEWAEEAPVLMKVRTLHPILALTIGTFLTVWLYKKFTTTTGFLKQVYFQSSALWALGLFFGIFTLIFLSPVWMKIGHLFLAHILWISLLRVFYWREKN